MKFLMGPVAFSRILENIPYSPIIINFLKRYGALIGVGAIIQTRVHIHCPQGIKKPFSNLTVGDDSYVDEFVFIDLSERVQIGKQTRLASGVKIYTHLADHLRGKSLKNKICAPVSIGDNCRVYPNSVITSGVKIGNNVIIGAGSIVLHNVELETNSLYAGAPAKLKARY